MLYLLPKLNVLVDVVAVMLDIHAAVIKQIVVRLMAASVSSVRMGNDLYAPCVLSILLH